MKKGNRVMASVPYQIDDPKAFVESINRLADRIGGKPVVNEVLVIRKWREDGLTEAEILDRLGDYEPPLSQARVMQYVARSKEPPGEVSYD